LGIDPGLATGMAIYNTETLKVEYVQETPDGVKGFKHPFLRDIKRVDCWSVENFTLRSSNKFTADLHGVEIIGWLKGEDYWGVNNPEPSQHMTITRLREKVDKYQDSVITHMLQAAGFKIGKGHTRMALSVAVWYAAMRLKHLPTLELLKPKDA
jgi:hypothetical protein